MTSDAPRQTLGLEEFLAGLPEEAAAEARAAAARIDALEQQIGPPGWIERNLLTLSVGALGLFALGIAGLVCVLSGLQIGIGLAWIVLLVSVFPAVVLAYLLEVRGRTRLDDAKMALNKRHFLPHGGLYFGALDGGGRVLRIEPPAKGEPDLRQRTQTQYEAATKRRWWW